MRSKVYLLAKRLFDITFSLIVIIVGFIPGLVLCVAIILDSPGCPLFRQERVGRGGHPIRIWKFRSMFSDAHEHPERYLSSSQLEEWSREQKVEGDSRITRIGGFLRRTSLDEIPQFINVLAGQLSVVGPRPVTQAETFEFGTERAEVLSVRPGITGWWQVTDRNEATWANGERQSRELYYVRNRSLMLDAHIIFMTFSAMLLKRTGR